jgi:hypothetical protein
MRLSHSQDQGSQPLRECEITQYEHCLSVFVVGKDAEDKQALGRDAKVDGI